MFVVTEAVLAMETQRWRMPRAGRKSQTGRPGGQAGPVSRTGRGGDGGRGAGPGTRVARDERPARSGPSGRRLGAAEAEVGEEQEMT